MTASNWNSYLGATGSLMETAAAKVTTAGDMVYATAANALARLAVGSSHQVLGVSSGSPAWGSTLPDASTIATSLAVGTNPASAGPIRLANTTAITWRNAANSGDVAGITVNGNNDVSFTPGGSGVVPSADNTWTLGGNGARWSAVWAANGTIQTSSRDAKNALGLVDPVAALEAALATPIHRFTYKGNENQPDLRDMVHVGFMADEADPLLCPDAANANAQTTASVALAAIQALAAEVRDLRAQLAAATGT